MPSPMPPLPPVTMATLPVRSKGLFSWLLSVCFQVAQGGKARFARAANFGNGRMGHATLSHL
jgi:hypothetical protein